MSYVHVTRVYHTWLQPEALCRYLRTGTGLEKPRLGTQGQRQGQETRAEGRKISAESDLEDGENRENRVG